MENLDKMVLEPADDGKILGIPITIEDIRSRISLLSTTNEGEPLKLEMNKLKAALKHNPEAANLLLPEEIGEMVKAIYKLTNRVAVNQTTAKTTRVAKKIDLSQIKEMPSDF